jgi:hypothetical protein
MKEVDIQYGPSVTRRQPIRVCHRATTKSELIWWEEKENLLRFGYIASLKVLQELPIGLRRVLNKYQIHLTYHSLTRSHKPFK